MGEKKTWVVNLLFFTTHQVTSDPSLPAVRYHSLGQEISPKKCRIHWDLGKWQMTVITITTKPETTHLFSHDFAVLSITQKVSFFLVATHGLQRYIHHPGVEIVEIRKANHHHKWFVYFTIIGDTPKSSIFIGLSIINHPFWESPIWVNYNISPTWLRPFGDDSPNPNYDFQGSVAVRLQHNLPRFMETPISCFMWLIPNAMFTISQSSPWIYSWYVYHSQSWAMGGLWHCFIHVTFF